MAFSNTYRINVDLKRRLTSVVPTFKQGDNGVLIFKIYDDGQLYNLTGYTSSEITFLLPDGQTLLGYPDLINGEIVYSFTRSEMAVPGRISTTLSITSGNTTVSIQPFNCFVFPSYKDEDLSYIGILQELIKEVQDLGMNLGETLERVTEALDLTEDALSKIVDITNNEEIRLDNEMVRVNSEDVRASQEAERVSEENIRIANESTRQDNEQQRQNRFAQINNEFEEKVEVLNQAKVLAYNPLTTYVPLNFVTYNGSTFAVLKSVTGVTPTDDGVNYLLAARRGVDGSGAVASVNGIFPTLDGNIELDLNSPDFINHVRNETNQKHIEVVTAIPANLANSGLIIQTDGAVPIVPGAPTLDMFEEDVREILNEFRDEITPLQAELTQHSNQITTLTNSTITLQNNVANLQNNTERATQVEAEVGTDNTKVMTPLRTKQLIERGGTFTGNLKIENVAPILEFSEIGDPGGNDGKFFIVADSGTLSIRKDDTVNSNYPIFIERDGAVVINGINIPVLFQSVSNGKEQIAAAITDKGVQTAADASFATLATNIYQISTGIKKTRRDTTHVDVTVGSGVQNIFTFDLTGFSFLPSYAVINLSSLVFLNGGGGTRQYFSTSTTTNTNEYANSSVRLTANGQTITITSALSNVSNGSCRITVSSDFSLGNNSFRDNTASILLFE